MANLLNIQIVLTPDEVLCRGLELVGFDQKRQQNVVTKKNLSRFRTHYSGNPATYAELLTRMQISDEPEARIDFCFDKVGIEKGIDYFFMGIHLLACYPVEEEAEGIFKCCDRTWRDWAWKIVKAISYLKDEIIVWPKKWSHPEDPEGEQTLFIITVDGAHFRVEEPTHTDFSENTIYYSHKFKQAALDYEIAISIFENKVVFAAGPYPAGVNDITVFRKHLMGKVLDSRKESGVKHRVIGDKGYRGESEILSVPTSHDTEEVRDFKGRAMSRQETFNARMKVFNCLDERFRHGIKKHRRCFNAVLVICQLQMENGSPLFKV